MSQVQLDRQHQEIRDRARTARLATQARAQQLAEQRNRSRGR